MLTTTWPVISCLSSCIAVTAHTDTRLMASSGLRIPIPPAPLGKLCYVYSDCWLGECWTNSYHLIQAGPWHIFPPPHSETIMLVAWNQPQSDVYTIEISKPFGRVPSPGTLLNIYRHISADLSFFLNLLCAWSSDPNTQVKPFKEKTSECFHVHRLALHFSENAAKSTPKATEQLSAQEWKHDTREKKIHLMNIH